MERPLCERCKGLGCLHCNASGFVTQDASTPTFKEFAQAACETIAQELDLPAECFHIVGEDRGRRQKILYVPPDVILLLLRKIEDGQLLRFARHDIPEDATICSVFYDDCVRSFGFVIEHASFELCHYSARLPVFDIATEYVFRVARLEAP